MLDYHRRMFRYEEWANREVVSGLQETRTPPGQAVALLAHIVSAQVLWLRRLQGKDTEVAIWPSWTLDQCVIESQPIIASWLDYLNSLSDADLDHEFQYHNSAGKLWTSTVGDTLTHVILHSVYHRAQIASAIRDEGFAPAYTDFIHATRSQQVE